MSNYSFSPSFATNLGMGGSGSSSPADTVNNLYSQWGKTGNLIDPEGYNYWLGRANSGEDITNAFNQSASTVYGRTATGQDTTPYASQNQQGLANLKSGNAAAPYSSNSGGGGNATSFLTQNPYLAQQANDIQRRADFSMDRQMSNIKGDFTGLGGIGGSRQGVAEGLVASMGADNIAGQLSNLYSNSWNADQNRQLGKYQSDQNYDLGTGGLQLGNRNADINSALAGGQLYNLGLQTQWSPINNANNTYGGYTGFGTTNGTSSQGGGGLGFLGGALGGAQLGNIAGAATSSYNPLNFGSLFNFGGT